MVNINPAETIRLTTKTGKFIVSQAGKLWEEGTGSPMSGHGVPLDTDPPGFIDEINPELTGLHEWAYALLSFARFVAGIVQYELDNEDVQEL